MNKLSTRLIEIIDALPLKIGMRILEIGCGPGAMAREISSRIGPGQVVAIDRSKKAIEQAIKGSQQEIESGKLVFRHVAIEDFELQPGEKPFDLAIAIRVGVLDGRHPEIERQAIHQIRKALTKKAKLLIDGGDPLKEIPFKNYPLKS
jgi:cyclopropane fatty-acyl-phospholipid synthase-like methyltransferase